MVTAGHCTEGVDEGRVYFAQSVAPNYDPNAFGGWGGDPTTGYPYQNGVTFHRADNYGFHDFEGFPERTSTSASSCSTRPSPRRERLRDPADRGAIDRYLAAAGNKKQARFTVSGYGLSDQDPRPGVVP